MAMEEPPPPRGPAAAGDSPRSEASRPDSSFTLPRTPSISPPLGGGAVRGIGEKFAANVVGWPSHLFMPADAKAYLLSTEFSGMLSKWGLADPTVNSYKTGKALPATALPLAPAATTTAKPPSAPPATPRKQPQPPSLPPQAPSRPLRLPTWMRKLRR